GYVLELGGKRVYISGDTEDIPEMRQLKNIDVAFVCMNLPYTMDINQAASAVLEFQPAIVYPYHYRGQGGLADVEGFRKLVEKGGTKVEVRLRNWYPRQYAPSAKPSVRHGTLQLSNPLDYSAYSLIG